MSLTTAIKYYSADQLITALFNSGYESSRKEWEKSFIQYLGLNKESQHVFAIGMIDDDVMEDDDVEYLITKLFVEVNSDGLISAEWQSMPDKYRQSAEETDTYFDALRDYRKFLESQQ